MTRAPGLPLAAAVAAGAAVALAAAWVQRERLRHVAVPVLVDPSLPPAQGTDLGDLPGCAARALAQVPGRVTALREQSGTVARHASPVEGEEHADRALWIGTFDGGLFRLAGGALSAVPGLRGRERFVNALAGHDGAVWAATQGGLVAYEGGRRVLTLLAGESVTALARSGPTLYAGTTSGVYRVSAVGGAERVAATGPSGEGLRVSALAASATRLWIGTASGAYSLALATADGPPAGRATRWDPLVFGAAAAQTNVVTALAPLADGAVAGTDDGGVVRLRDEGGTTALRFAEPRANEVNPGAASAAPGGGALVGTQGGGVLLVRADAGGLAAARLGALGRAAISAVDADGERILVATASGAVSEVRCDLPRAPAIEERGANR